MKLTGLIAATYTPFLPDGSINLDLISPLTEYMLDQGVSGLYVNGSTGEGESLTIEERKVVAKAFVDAVGNRVPVVIQVGHNALRQSQELALHAQKIGADAISSLPPSYFKPQTLEDLLSHVEVIAKSVPQMPYYYYHIPRMNGVGVDLVDFLKKASDRIPSLQGIKFSDFFLADFMACQEADNGKYDILFGSDEMLLGALACGAEGAVGSCYGFAGKLWRNIIAAYQQGERLEAKLWMRKAARMVREIGSLGPFHACVKEVIWPILGFEVGSLRLPQPRLNLTEINKARKHIGESGLAGELISGNFSCRKGF